MTDVIEAINGLVKIGKSLRDVSELVNDVKTKNLIADLNLALADLKMQFADLQNENLALKKRIKTLESGDNIRGQLTIKDAAYWFSSSPPIGHPAGPYCTGCFDLTEKLIVLREMPFDFQFAGKYECPVCKQFFGR